MSRNDANHSEERTTSQALEYLLTLPRFAGKKGNGYKPGLERIGALLNAMGNPQEAFEIVHVAGTNGKGSTAAMVAAMFTADGRRCGLHTSPHLHSITERLRVNGSPAQEEWLSHAADQHRSLFQEIEASFFEATLALSLLYFAEKQVDIAVVEVGLGGRLDATNILCSDLTIITHIGLDHQHLLGNSLAEIAREKAGIIKKGVPVISGVKDDAARAEIERVAQEQTARFLNAHRLVRMDVLERSAGSTLADIHLPDWSLDRVTIGLGGRHQVENAAVAILAGAELGLQPEAIREGLTNVEQLSGIKARLEVLQTDPLILLDTGHNMDAWRSSLHHVADSVTGRISLILGVMKDKDIGELGQLLHAFDAQVFVVDLQTERALPAEILSRTLREQGVDVHWMPTIAEARSRFLEGATASDALLITGSHFVVEAAESL